MLYQTGASGGGHGGSGGQGDGQVIVGPPHGLPMTPSTFGTSGGNSPPGSRSGGLGGGVVTLEVSSSRSTSWITYNTINIWNFRR